MMPWALSGLVYEVGGRTVAVQPDTQMVLLMVDCVTAELYEPGVQVESGSGRYAWEQVLAWAVPALTPTMRPLRVSARTEPPTADIRVRERMGGLPGGLTRRRSPESCP